MVSYVRSVLGARDEDGASAVEYGLLISGVAALIVAFVFYFGGMVTQLFSGTCNTVKTQAALTSSCS